MFQNQAHCFSGIGDFEGLILIITNRSHKYLTNLWGRFLRRNYMRYTVNLDCKTHYIKKDGTVPLTLRVSINGEHDYLNTGKHIKIEHYDAEAKALKSGFAGHGQLDAFIT